MAMTDPMTESEWFHSQIARLTAGLSTLYARVERLEAEAQCQTSNAIGSVGEFIATDPVMTEPEWLRVQVARLTAGLSTLYARVERLEADARSEVAIDQPKFRNVDIAQLADAVWQVLDDMGVSGQSTCLATKALLRVAFEQFHDPIYDEMGMPLKDAEDILIDVGMMMPRSSKSEDKKDATDDIG